MVLLSTPSSLVPGERSKEVDGPQGHAGQSIAPDLLTPLDTIKLLSELEQSIEKLLNTDDVIDKSPVVQDAESNVYLESSSIAHSNYYGSYIEAMTSGLTTEFPGAQDIIKILLDSIHLEASQGTEQLLLMEEFVQGLLLRIQEEGGTQSADQEMEQYVLEEQRQIFHVQQRGIDRLVSIQERIQDAAALAFAESAHPVPRMFVVLPCTSPSQHGLQYPVSTSDFRLFFLCECDHQPANRVRSTSNIHLARHEGYELQDTKEFFQNYTPYLMSMIHVIKNGITTPGFNVPSLSHLTLADSVNEVQGILGLADNTIESLMDDMIPYLHGWDALKNSMDSRVALDVLESTDLHSVVKHLKGYRSQLVSD